MSRYDVDEVDDIGGAVNARFTCLDACNRLPVFDAVQRPSANFRKHSPLGRRYPALCVELIDRGDGILRGLKGEGHAACPARSRMLRVAIL